MDGDWPSVPPPLTRGSSVASGSSSGSGSGQLTPAPVTEGGGDHVVGAIASEQFAQAMASLSLDDELWNAGNQQDGPAVIASDQTGWAGYVFKTEDDDKPKEPEIECKTHGKLCKKGICKQYKAQKRERERAKEAAQRNAEKEKRIAEKAKKDQNPTGLCFPSSVTISGVDVLSQLRRRSTICFRLEMTHLVLLLRAALSQALVGASFLPAQRTRLPPAQQLQDPPQVLPLHDLLKGVV